MTYLNTSTDLSEFLIDSSYCDPFYSDHGNSFYEGNGYGHGFGYGFGFDSNNRKYFGNGNGFGLEIGDGQGSPVISGVGYGYVLGGNPDL
jgi:hypothetical protein